MEHVFIVLVENSRTDPIVYAFMTLEKAMVKAHAVKDDNELTDDDFLNDEPNDDDGLLWLWQSGREKGDVISVIQTKIE